MKKLISMLLVIFTLTTAAVSPTYAATATTKTTTELSEISPEVPETVKTKKTKFGKTIYSNPIRINGTNKVWEIYSVRIVKVDLLKRYAKKSTKIETKIEFVSSKGFYFYTNCPGNYYLEIKFKGPSGKIYNFSESYLTQVYVPDSKYSFSKGTKTTLDLGKTSYYAGEDLPYEDYLPSVTLARSEVSTPVPGTYQEFQLIALEGAWPGWEIYSVRIVKVEILERYRDEAKNLKTKITFYNYRAYTLSANMPGEYWLEVKVKSPSGKICLLTANEYQKIYSKDGKYVFLNNPRFFTSINKTYKYKGETREK